MNRVTLITQQKGRREGKADRQTSQYPSQGQLKQVPGETNAGVTAAQPGTTQGATEAGAGTTSGVWQCGSAVNI